MKNIKFSIKTKFFIIILIPALLLLFVIYLDYVNLSSLGRSAELILSKNYKSIQVAQQIRQLLEVNRNRILMTFFQQDHSTTSHQNFENKTFRITHPFHPYRNIEFEIDSVRRFGYECRVFFFNAKGRKSSVPHPWTDIGPKDPFVTVSAGRSLFRVEDLPGLVRLIGEITSARRK